MSYYKFIWDTIQDLTGSKIALLQIHVFNNF